MPVITLTTEWQGKDFYSGILKGKLTSLCPEASIVDNASAISPFNIQQAAFIIRNTFRHYPEGSIHIICMQTEASDKQPHLIVESQGHFFIGADNGIFHLILNSKPETIIRIDNEKGKENTGDIDTFARAAAHIATKGSAEGAGTEMNELKEMIPLRATIEENAISGSIIFIDSYGNAISNITRDVFQRVFSKKQFNIAIRSNNNIIDHLSSTYNSESVGELLAIFNSLDLLEIGINGSDASELLSLQPGDVVRVATAGSNKKPGTLF